jgi:hypothetical protein
MFPDPKGVLRWQSTGADHGTAVCIQGYVVAASDLHGAASLALVQVAGRADWWITHKGGHAVMGGINHTGKRCSHYVGSKSRSMAIDSDIWMYNLCRCKSGTFRQ